MSAAPNLAPRAPGAKPRVLIIDDSAVVRGLVARWIENDPRLEVAATCADGEQGVRKAGELQPELVVLDIEMPRMDGLTALPLILKAAPRARVVMASTLTRKGAEVTMRALSLGAADYAPKPEAGRVAGAGRVVDAQWPTETELADVFAAYARERGITHVLVPKDVEQAFPGVESQALVSALRDAGLTEARLCPTGPAALHRALLVARSLASTAVLFVVSLAFDEAGRLCLSFESPESVVPAPNGRVEVEPTGATFGSEDTLQVTLAATVPADDGDGTGLPLHYVLGGLVTVVVSALGRTLL